MFRTFFIGLMVFAITSYMIFSNYKKMSIFTRHKIILFIIALALFTVHIVIKSIYNIDNIISTIVINIIWPIYIFIFLYLICSKILKVKSKK